MFGKAVSLIVIVASTVVLSQECLAEVVGFEDISIPVNSDIDAADFQSGSLLFDISHDQSNFLNGSVPDFSYNGSTYLFVSGAYDPSVPGWVYPTVTITHVTGVPFDLNSIDLAETLLGSEVYTVRLTGNLAAGGSVTRDIILDGLTDGFGGVPDFETFSDFNTSWDGLISVTLQTLTGNRHGTWSLDQVIFDWVPDNCPGIDNPGQEDTDSDNIGDACDNCVYDHNPGQADTDGDGIGDACEINDVDGDGWDAANDNCVDVANPDQANADSDEYGDACDNCTDTANNGQEDADGDGIGDACDVPGISVLQTIDFEEIAIPPNSYIDSENFTSMSFSFEVANGEANFLNGEVLFGSLDEPVAYNGSTYFFSHGFYDPSPSPDNPSKAIGWVYPSTVMTRQDGGAFDLRQLDISETLLSAGAHEVEIVGAHPDDSTETRNVTLDLLVDGTGPRVDFETLLFDYKWAELTSVTFTALSGAREAEWAIDNLIVGTLDCFDQDGDGLCDHEDLCPEIYDDNTDTNLDGIGDACQCGDIDGDGDLTPADVLAILYVIWGFPEYADPLSNWALGDLTGDGLTDNDDAIAIHLAITGYEHYLPSSTRWICGPDSTPPPGW